MLDRPVNRFIRAGLITAGLFFANVSALAKDELTGVVTAISGDVKLLKESKWSRAQVGLKVLENDQLATGPGGMVQVRYPDGNSFTVYEKASVKVSEYRLNYSQGKTLNSAIDVAYGKLRFFVNPKGDTKKNIKFRSKSAVMGVRGTSGIISVERGGQAQLHVISGQVEVFNPKLPNMKVTVGALSMTRVNPSGAPSTPVVVPATELKALVPQVPQESGFSDDSATASSNYKGSFDSGLSDSPSASPERESKEGEGDNSEIPGREEDSNQDDTQRQGIEGPSGEEPQSSPEGSEQTLSPRPDGESPSQLEKSEQRTRPTVTVFMPGGEIVEPTPGGGLAPNPALTDNTSLNSGRRTESQDGGAESDSFEDVVSVTTGGSTTQVLERVTTDLEKINSITEGSLEKVKAAQSNKTPESRVIQIKVPLPKN